MLKVRGFSLVLRKAQTLPSPLSWNWKSNLGNHFFLSIIRTRATTSHIPLSNLYSLPPLIVIMATESLSHFDELDSICQRIAQSEWRDRDVALGDLKRKASNNLSKLSVDLEEPGDLLLI